MAPKNRFTMNRKDFRILVRNSEIDANPDYVTITNADAATMLVATREGKHARTGLTILKQMLITDREKDLETAEGELQTLTLTASTPDAGEEAGDVDPELEREEDQLPPAYATMKAADLRAIATSRNIPFPAGMKKSAMIDRLLQP